MKTLRKTIGNTTYFIMADLDPAYEPVARSLHYSPFEDGFAKSFPSISPNIERIYGNFERSAEEMILQAAHVNPIPWEETLQFLLDITAGEEINWWLVGSAALTIRGIPVEPRDVDLVVDAQGAQILADLLLDHLVEPLVYSEDWVAEWFTRSFLQTRLEWIGGVRSDLDDKEVTDFGPVAESRRELVVWHGKEILVPPLDLQLEVTKRRGLYERAQHIEEFLQRVG